MSESFQCTRTGTRRALPSLVGLLVVLGCESPTVAGIDYGECAPSAPEAATLAGLRFEMEAEPNVIAYQVSSRLTIRVANATDEFIELGSAGECLLAVWVRGESPIGETHNCYVFQIQQSAESTSTYSTGVQFRPPGTPRRRFRGDPVNGYHGPAAPPATYCWAASIMIGPDTVRLETPFRLQDG